MKIRTIAQNRKEIVAAISEVTNLKAVYLGPPTFGYKIGEFTVDREGMVETMNQENGLEMKRVLIEKGLCESEADSMELKIPIERHTGASLKNLVFIIHSKQYLLNKAVGRQTFQVNEALVSKLEKAEPEGIEDFMKILNENGGNEANYGFYFTDDAIVFDGFPLEGDKRKHYFGSNWDSFPDDSEGYYLAVEKTNVVRKRSINEIADSADITSTDSRRNDQTDEDNIRFESFLTFRHFLLHVLRIFELEENGDETASQKEWNGELIDDKKLIQRFETVFPRKQSTSKYVERFGMCLLRCRFLFDTYMLKREFNGDDTEGRWSLKMLKVSWSNSRKYAKLQPKAYYVDVPDVDESRMLQSMLRVTYTSPLVMHWVTDYLAWLYFDMYEYDPIEVAGKLESIAKTQVRKYVENGDYSIGLNTSHIVFNYLDYLLWLETKLDFQFEFRNSVEHWYPQHPIDSNIRWDDATLNHFGNLCLVSSGLNSKFSNNLPLAKKANFGDGIKGQSLKLQRMADATSDADAWTENAAIAHGKEMLAKLEQALSKE